MSPRPLNEEYLEGNACFGCGLANPDGLQIRVYRDGDRTDRLVGSYTPRESHAGFPRIVHGGLQFTGLDCMAAWLMLTLRAQGPMMPLTTKASIRFKRPVLVDEPLTLTACTEREAPSAREPVLIHTELRNAGGEVLSEADFEYVLLPAAQFQKLVGLDELPDAFRRHFGLETAGTESR